MLSKIIQFIRVDIWRIRSKDLPKMRSFLIRQLRVVLVTVRGFAEDKCQLRASALTFYSLLSIVPVIAVAFGFAKGFGFEKLLEKKLLEQLPGQAEVVTKIINFANSLLEQTKGGLIAGIGLLILFWSVIKVLGHIEKSFNDIWGIKKARSLGRKFSDFLSVMLVCPILFIMSSSLTVVVAGQVEILVQKIALLGVFSPLIFAIVKCLPYCVIWILFSFIYIFMPNTEVSFKSGILAGIVAGTIYQFVQWIYINFQIGVAAYNAIYGSFAALPLFLLWLQLSWLIILLGAEVSFAHQNIDIYEYEPDCSQVSYSFKRLLTLWIAHLLVKNFCRGEKPLTDSEISHILEIPIRLVRQILYELVEAGVISETNGEEGRAIAYQPARDVKLITVKNVIDMLEQHGNDKISVAKSKALDKISELLKTFSEVIKKSTVNLPLKDI